MQCANDSKQSSSFIHPCLKMWRCKSVSHTSHKPLLPSQRNSLHHERFPLSTSEIKVCDTPPPSVCILALRKRRDSSRSSRFEQLLSCPFVIRKRVSCLSACTRVTLFATSFFGSVLCASCNFLQDLSCAHITKGIYIAALLGLHNLRK